MPSRSHQIVYQPIWRELSIRGHELVVITPNPLNDPLLTNLTEIDISFYYDFVDEGLSSFKEEVSHWQYMKIMITDGYFKFYDTLLSLPKIQELIKDEAEHFDLIIAECIAPIVHAFSHRFKCPLIGIASTDVFFVTHEAVGNPTHPILYPDLRTTFGKYMSFYQKIEAVLFYIYSSYLYHAKQLPIYDEMARRHFGKDTPKLLNLVKNMSALFLSTNPILHGARPLAPGVFQLGRLHLEAPKPLSEDLKSFLDSAVEGLIYFSLGSNIKSKYVDESKRLLIAEVFSELPYKVLWKFEDEEMPNKPKNVKISKWMPQQDILRHKNVKLFITQAGLQSIEEAIAYGVPILALPFFSDQHSNAWKAQDLGIGLKLQFSRLTKEKFREAVMELIGNSSYKKRIVELSDIIQDEPTSSLERAIWWSEYVIRHKGTPFSRGSVVNLSLYEYLMVDVFAFLTFFVVIAMVITYFIGKLIILRIIKGAVKYKYE